MLRAVLSRLDLRIIEEDRAGHNHSQHDERIQNSSEPIPYAVLLLCLLLPIPDTNL